MIPQASQCSQKQNKIAMIKITNASYVTKQNIRANEIRKKSNILQDKQSKEHVMQKASAVKLSNENVEVQTAEVGRQRQGVQRKGEDPMLIAWLYGVKRYRLQWKTQEIKVPGYYFSYKND